MRTRCKEHAAEVRHHCYVLPACYMAGRDSVMMAKGNCDLYETYTLLAFLYTMLAKGVMRSVSLNVKMSVRMHNL